MKYLISLTLLAFLALAPQLSFGQTPAECGQTATFETINSASSWTSTGGWIGGVVPSYGTNPITIPAGAIVKISSSNFSVSANMIINGTMIIDGKLTMASGNTITVNSGGKISCCSTCGASDKIDIGTGSAEWDGASGPSTITGPASVSNGVLPIELLSFSGKIIDSGVVLEWATATELNFDYFKLEKSTDGKSFQEIGRIAGHGTTQVRKDYAFDDSYPFIGKSYYRLTSVDFDGYTETFDLATVTYQGVKSATVFPNPAVDGKINIDLSFTPTEPVSLLITDLSGLAIARYTTDKQAASFQAELNPGTYLVKVTGDGLSQVIRVVVR